MSFQTDADRLLDLVKEKVHEAVVALGKIVVEQDNGYQEYGPAFQRKLKNSLLELMEIRDRLE